MGGRPSFLEWLPCPEGANTDGMTPTGLESAEISEPATGASERRPQGRPTGHLADWVRPSRVSLP